MVLLVSFLVQWLPINVLPLYEVCLDRIREINEFFLSYFYDCIRADLGFSQRGGGADFQILFFRSTKLILRALPKHCFVPICFVRRRQKAFLGTFWKISTKKSRFFRRALPLKARIYWRHRRLKKIFRVRRQNWISQNSTKGCPFGRQGVESLREGASAPSKSAPACM